MRYGILRRRAAFSLVELLVVVAIIGLLVALLLPAVQQAREAARRMQCSSQLKQLALAIHHYESACGAYPPAGIHWSSPAGYPNHSIIPLLLPYLEQASVRDLYDMSVAWDHAKNAQAIQQPLALLRCPSAPHHVANGTDYYPGTDFLKDGAARKRLVERGINPGNWEGMLIPQTSVQYKATITQGDVRDGLSNTFLYFEDAGRPMRYNIYKRQTYDGSGQAIKNKFDTGLWADSQGYFNVDEYCHDLQLLNCMNAEEVFSFHQGGCNFAMGDGSVRFETDALAPEVFVALFTRAGGDIVRR